MVVGFFGTPGSGKSTLLTKYAIRELRKLKSGKSAYKHVLTNFPVYGCEQVQVSDLGRYEIENSLILIDEITLDCDSRDYKNFSVALKNFFTLHRHVGNDVIYFMQDPSRVDKSIRNVTYSLYYVSSPITPFFRRFTVARRVFRNFDINEYSSELILGYRFPKLKEMIFLSTMKICYRPFYYKYFNSFDKLQLDNLPAFDFQKW